MARPFRDSEIMAGFLRIGSPAPAFEARDADGNLVRLRDFAGRSVVLYFYPEDETPGCTREACAFRDGIDAFRAKDAAVLGVSTQDEASHRAFREKYGLTFPLLADPEGRICRAYRALGILGIARRVTYVIGPDGTVRAAFRRLDPRAHVPAALRAVANLSGGS